MKPVTEANTYDDINLWPCYLNCGLNESTVQQFSNFKLVPQFAAAATCEQI